MRGNRVVKRARLFGSTLEIVETDLVPVSEPAEACYASTEHRIYLLRSLRGRKRRDTLYHELVHAILDMSGIGKWLCKDSDHEEGIACLLGPALAQVADAELFE